MPATGTRSDPFVGFVFSVQVQGLALGGFSECSGLQLETEFLDFMAGGENEFVYKLPTRTKQSNLTLKRGIVDRSLWDWYWALVQGKVERRDVTIVLGDPAGQREQQWQLLRALPAKWLGPELNGAQSNVAVETLELTYQNMLRP